MDYETLRGLSSLLFPNHCPVCGKLLALGTEICPACYDRLPFVTEPRCYRCGKPVSDPSQEYCFDCRIFPKSFQGGCALLLYNRITKPAMMDLKYHNRRRPADFFGRCLARRWGAQILSWHPDVLVPIPVHRTKRKKRGYNQAELLSKALSRHLHLPVDSTLLIRTQDTLPQKQFSPRARLANLEGAFEIHPKYQRKQKKYHTVLLVDDIYTTGATMETCTRILHQAGIGRVYICSVCIGLSRD